MNRLKRFSFVWLGLTILLILGTQNPAFSALNGSCTQIQPVQTGKQTPVQFRIICPDVSQISVVTKSSVSNGNNLTKLAELPSTPGTWVGAVPTQFFKSGEQVQFILIFQPASTGGIVQESIRFKTQ